MVFLYPFLGIACLWDYNYRKIPNILQMTLFGLGMLDGYFRDSWKGVLSYAAVFVCVILLFSPFFRLGMIGGGDVKMLGISSGFFGPGKALYFVFFSMVVCAGIALVKMVKNRMFKERIRTLFEYVSMWTGTAGRMAFCRGSPGRTQGLYLRDRNEKIRCGIAMSGPMLVSALLHWGGVY